MFDLRRLTPEALILEVVCDGARDGRGLRLTLTIAIEMLARIGVTGIEMTSLATRRHCRALGRPAPHTPLQPYPTIAVSCDDDLAGRPALSEPLCAVRPSSPRHCSHRVKSIAEGRHVLQDTG